MTRKDEEYLLESIAQIREETHLNNMMLCDLCDVVNVYLANHNSENEEDFGRNILANVLSQFIDIKSLRR
jgi:hypothetical protein